ncbi:MAG TPA: AsmA family protein, partial [Burkholderiales bacterium]|nr:AsmA family protein [Burkholderiales bacterium]
ALTFDANRYKPQIERLVQEKTGRTLKLQGPLEAAIWPSLGAKVAGITFSEHGSEQQFVALDSAHASVALLPLLRGQVVVDRIRISGFKANVTKQKDGRFNFSDLLEAKAEPGKAPGKDEKKPAEKGGESAPVAVDLAGIDIDKSAIVYRDLSTGKEYSISDFKLATGRVAERADGKLQMHAAVKAPDLDVKLDLGSDYKLDLPGQTLALDNFSLKLSGKEETNIKGRLALAKVLTFDLNVDKLNVDAYMPAEQKPAAASSGPSDKPAPPAKPAADTPVDLSALKDLNADGKLQIGALQVRGLKLANVKTEVKAAGGKLEAPHSANLYEGTLSGTLGLQADGRVALKDALNGISIGPLLRDAAQQDKLEGKGNLALDVNAAGKSVNAMKRSLGGTAKIDLRDGAIKGIDIGAILSKARSALGQQQAQAAATTERTDFSAMTASFNIKNGVAHNEDLDIKAPLFRITGRGDIDIGNSSLDYVTKAAVVATAKGQGGAEADQLSGITVPVRLSGSFDNMKYDVNYGAVATDLAKSKAGEKLREKLEERLGVGKSDDKSGQGGSTADKLRGLFGR